jgi:hypothetical protein
MDTRLEDFFPALEKIFPSKPFSALYLHGGTLPFYQISQHYKESSGPAPVLARMLLLKLTYGAESVPALRAYHYFHHSINEIVLGH